MTRTTNARLAGFTFLCYIAIGLTSMVLFRRATGGAEGTAAMLASLTQHPTAVRLTVLLTFLMFLAAVVLGVTLYALTREQDRDLAILALCCRATEGVIGASGAVQTLGLLSPATCFAVGSSIFSYLFLRARSIPVPLAWLGVLSSSLLLVALTLQIAGFLRGPATYYVWIPLAVFEVTLALWLLIKGVAPIRRSQA